MHVVHKKYNSHDVDHTEKSKSYTRTRCEMNQMRILLIELHEPGRFFVVCVELALWVIY